MENLSLNITNKDVLWSYGATFMKIASSALILPFILRMMPPEMVGIWSVFMTVTALTYLLDFGFSPSFARNITYIFSGVSTLKQEGFETIGPEVDNVNFGLLKGTVAAMRWFYLRASIVLFLLLSTLGTFYIFTLMHDYKGDHNEVYIAWILLCVINTYNIYTLYYDALLQGKGLIKRSKQIIVIGQSVYVLIASVLILSGFGLIAIVSAQASSVIIVRVLSYKSFFTREIEEKLADIIALPIKEVLDAIYPNAIKIGLTSIGGFMVQKSAMVIGSLYLPLKDIASYGTTIQLIAVIAGLSGIYILTFQPKISQLRIVDDMIAIKKLYLRGQIFLFGTYLVCGLGLVFFGEAALRMIGSQTQLLSKLLLCLAIITSLIETNLIIAGNILLSKNIVPFLKASLISGGAIIAGLLISFNFTDGGLIILLIIPLIVDIAYQAWKWPWEVIKDLQISIRLSLK